MKLRNYFDYLCWPQLNSKITNHSINVIGVIMMFLLLRTPSYFVNDFKWQKSNAKRFLFPLMILVRVCD